MRRRKTALVLLLALVGLIGIWQIGKPPAGFLSASPLAHLASHVANLNTVDVQLAGALAQREVRVMLEADDAPPRLVYASTGPYDDVPYSYGGHVFHVQLSGAEIGSFRHFKENDWYSNTYRFVIRPDGEGISVDFLVVGPRS